MDAGYFIIAILGCADGSVACTPVATVPTHFASKADCSAASEDALLASSDLDFPTLMAECRALPGPASAARARPVPTPAGALRG